MPKPIPTSAILPWIPSLAKISFALMSKTASSSTYLCPVKCFKTYKASALPILFLGEVCAPVTVGLIYLSVFISVPVSSSLDLIFINRSTDETPHVSLKSFSTSKFGPSLLLSTYLVCVNFFIFSVSVSELCHIGFNCLGVF